MASVVAATHYQTVPPPSVTQTVKLRVAIKNTTGHVTLTQFQPCVCVRNVWTTGQSSRSEKQDTPAQLSISEDSLKTLVLMNTRRFLITLVPIRIFGSAVSTPTDTYPLHVRMTHLLIKCVDCSVHK